MGKGGRGKEVLKERGEGLIWYWDISTSGGVFF